MESIWNPVKKMRILPIIDTQRIGGPGKGLVMLIKSLQRHCEIPGIVLFRRNSSMLSDFAALLASEGIQTFNIDERRAFDYAALPALLGLIRQLEPDIIQTHGYKANFYLMLLSLLRAFHGGKWLAWVHGWTSENFRVKIYHLLEVLSVQYSDIIICVAENLKRRLKVGSRKVKVIPNAIDDDYIRIPTPDLDEMRKDLNLHEKRVVLVVGRFSHEKGQDRIPSIAAEIRKLRKDVVFLLVGEGPEQKNLARLIHDKEVQDMVIIHPYVSDIRPFYLLADICLLPSRKEGMPNVVLEAMYMKCLVVAFDIGGVDEILRHRRDGYLIKPGDVPGMANTISRLLDDTETSNYLKESAHNRIREHFLSSLRSERVLAVYKELLDAQH
ncbi:MAG: glycosyltransferase [Anaerolineaceae bacterium]